MGRQVCGAVVGDHELELVGVVDPSCAGSRLADLLVGSAAGSSPHLQVLEDVEQLADEAVEVAVDFTVPEAAVRTMRWCAKNDVHAVVGTTGVARDTMEELADLFAASRANCVIAPNFAIGAVLMMRFAETAAQYMDGAEVIELHHDAKVDAPSGTALLTAERISRARKESGSSRFAADRTEREPLPGSRGATAEGELHIHSVRLPGMVAHQEVIFGAQGQSLTLRHDAYDRSSFMPGVLRAVKAVPTLDGLVHGLDAVLGL